MEARKCDLCGVFYTENKNPWKEFISEKSISSIALGTKAGLYAKFDLCDNCVQRLMDFLSGGKETKQ